MTNKFKPYDKTYIVESSRIIREVMIVKFVGGLYTIQFTDTKGGIKVIENRLYPTKEEAESTIPKQKPRYRSPWEH